MNKAQNLRQDVDKLEETIKQLEKQIAINKKEAEKDKTRK